MARREAHQPLVSVGRPMRRPLRRLVPRLARMAEAASPPLWPAGCSACLQFHPAPRLHHPADHPWLHALALQFHPVRASAPGGASRKHVPLRGCAFKLHSELQPEVHLARLCCCGCCREKTEENITQGSIHPAQQVQTTLSVATITICGSCPRPG